MLAAPPSAATWLASAMPNTQDATAPPTVFTELVSPVATPVCSAGAAAAAAAGSAATSAPDPIPESYRDYIYREPVQFAGFKLFYGNDTKKGHPLMTPAQVLELEPKPVYIQYQ